MYQSFNQITGEINATKVIKLSKFEEVKKLDEFLSNEVKVLSKLSHRNIIKFKEIFRT